MFDSFVSPLSTSSPSMTIPTRVDMHPSGESAKPLYIITPAAGGKALTSPSPRQYRGVRTDRSLVAHFINMAAFERRCIRSGCVALLAPYLYSTSQSRALPVRRIDALCATPYL